MRVQAYVSSLRAGPPLPDFLQELKDNHFVITSYGTVTAESRRRGRSDLLFGVTWNRVVLDEVRYSARNAHLSLASPLGWAAHVL